MNKTNIAPRLTHRYIDACSHRDKWGSPIKIKVMPGRIVEGPDGVEENTVSLLTVVAPPLPRRGSASRRRAVRLLKRAIADSMSGSNCQHEWDCCGCWSRSARVIHTKCRNFTVRISAGRNY